MEVPKTKYLAAILFVFSIFSLVYAEDAPEVCKEKPAPKCSTTGLDIVNRSSVLDLLQDCRAVPNILKGSISGYRLFETEPCGALESAGFRQCDTVLKVNDRKLDSPVKMMEIFELLKLSGGTAIIIRSGKTMTLKFR